MRAVLPAVVVLVAALLAGGAPRSAADLPEQFVAVTPGGANSVFAPPVVAVEPGGALTLASVDVFGHSLVSNEYGPGTQPWCSGFQPGRCPLFWSFQVSLGGTTPVRGLESLVPGTVYPFYCFEHLGMKGTLVALPSTG